MQLTADSKAIRTFRKIFRHASVPEALQCGPQPAYATLSLVACARDDERLPTWKPIPFLPQLVTAVGQTAADQNLCTLLSL
eukprot:364397-Chlamydomonas_euryale.AAC.15